MAIYSLSMLHTVSVSTMACDLVAVGSGAQPRLCQLALILRTGLSAQCSLRRTTAIGTRTSPTTLLPEDATDPALTGITDVSMATAWSADPTMQSDWLRSARLAGTIGVGIIWTFPKPLVLPANAASGQICVNLDANLPNTLSHAVIDL